MKISCYPSIEDMLTETNKTFKEVDDRITLFPGKEIRFPIMPKLESLSKVSPSSIVKTDFESYKVEEVIRPWSRLRMICLVRIE